MKKIVFLFCVVIVSVFFVGCVFGGGDDPKPEETPSVVPTPTPVPGSPSVGFSVGDIPPDFMISEAIHMEGQTLPVRLSDFQGKIVILNFWASWCGPCKTEMPSLQALFEQFKGRDVVILTIHSNVRESIESGKNFISSNEFSFPVVFDKDRKINSLYGITSIPRTWIIDKNGIIRFFLIGGPIDFNHLESRQFIEELLNE